MDATNLTSSSSSSSSSDSEIDANPTAFNFDNDDATSRPAPEEGSETEEGFVSGEDDFAVGGSDRAFIKPADQTLAPGGASSSENGNGGVKLVSSSEFFTRPIAKVSVDSDDDDVAENEEEEEVFKEAVAEKGLSFGEEDAVVKAVPVEVLNTGAAVVGGDAEVPAGVTLENEFEKIRGEFEEVEEVSETVADADDSVVVAKVAVDDKVVEERSVEIDDSVVEAVNVDVLNTGVAVVGGDVEKIEESEIKGLEFPAAVSLENGFNQISNEAELPIDSVLVDAEPETQKEVVSDSASAEVVEEPVVDSVVDAVHVDLSHTGAAVVGDVEKVEESEIKGIEVPRGVSLENGYDQINGDVELSDSEKVFVADVGNLEQEPVVADDGDKSDLATGQEGPVTEIAATEVKIVSDEPESDDHVSNINVTNVPESVEMSLADKEIRLDEEEEKPSLDESGEHQEISVEAEDDDVDDDDKDDDGEHDGMIFGSSAAAKQFLEELERESGTGSHSGAESYGERSLSYRDDSQRVDGQIVTDSDEEVDTDEEGGGKELFDSAALAALLKAATGGGGSDGGNVTFTSPDGSRLFSVERPAGLGPSMRPMMRPGARPNPSALFSNAMVGGDTDNNLSEEERTKLEKFQQIRVKFLRLVQRLGVSAEDSIAKQVLYRLALVSGRQSSREFSLEAARDTALELVNDDFDFSLNILVLGKTGVGKSATINSIFGVEKTPINAFGPATSTVREIFGEVDGIKLRVFDTPGLKSAAIEQNTNRKILSSVQKFTKKCPPDIVLYVDRLDTQSRDSNDVPVLRSITSVFGSSIWRNTIVTLTHAASAPPDGPSGSPLNYELFVAQRSQIVQHTIGQAIGDIRFTNPNNMSPISLVENHPSCRRNREGEKVLPNGQSWRPQLLLLSSSMKILAEATNLSKPAEVFDHRKLFGFRTRAPPLPYMLSWLLQSRTHPKLAGDQGGENADSDIDMADMSDSDDEEEEDEYDQLPSFKPLKKAQIAKLSKEQKKAYLEEYDYRVKLLQKKMWREELKRMKEMKGNKGSPDEYGYLGEEDPENGAPAAVPVALPDMVLPPSFDSESPAYRYRFLEPTSQFLARPVLDAQGWDHDCGYDGVNLEFSQAIANTFPGTVSVQVTKDKKDFTLHLDSSVAAKHGENGSTMAGLDIQNVGKQLAYIVRGETKWKNLKKNKTTGGVSVTFLGENISTGVKLEDQFPIGKRLVLVGGAGTVRSQSDVAYGANVELRLETDGSRFSNWSGSIIDCCEHGEVER